MTKSEVCNKNDNQEWSSPLTTHNEKLVDSAMGNSRLLIQLYFLLIPYSIVSQAHIYNHNYLVFPNYGMLGNLE